VQQAIGLSAKTDLKTLELKLKAGLEALNFVSPEQQALSEPLLAFLALLSKWNQAYNLTSVRDPQEMLSLHLLDCLATIEPIESFLGQTPSQLIDVGSGGGLPGIIFALAWPECEHHLVETVGKKVAFLQQCKQQLSLLNLHAHHHRIEKFKLEANDTKRIFTCRAFASLSDFVSQTWHMRQDQSIWIALKGQRPDEEISDLVQLAERQLHQSLSIQVQEIHPPSLEQSKRHLIFIRVANLEQADRKANSNTDGKVQDQVPKP
jgi:16S rRNA (guanine527-N7)-methyltransferase